MWETVNKIRVISFFPYSGIARYLFKLFSTMNYYRTKASVCLFPDTPDKKKQNYGETDQQELEPNLAIKIC